ncbi:MAG: TlpA family protein disulfide reductase [Niastella sp.]|nr:TlpA family protein disulfide reductase [Niastella sp.]
MKLYNKYKSEGLEILGVSFDKKKEPWLKAIKDDEFPWQQVPDLKFWDNEVGKLYGIRLIPANILLDPNGNIIARNLHGEELEKKLEQVFNK